MNRITCIDALRGLAMFMVVFVHIEGFGLFIEEFHISLLRRICESIMLPLFFFVSGFCFKIQTVTDLIKAGLRLLIPAFIMGIVYSLSIDKDILSFLSNIYKYGYWFTLTLYEMFIILFCLIKVRNSKNGFAWLLVSVSCLLYLVKIPFNNIQFLVKVGNAFCLHQLFIYFQYFSIGYIFACCKETFNELINKELVTVISIFVFILALYIKCNYTDEELATSIPLKIYRAIQDPVLAYAGLAIVIRFFYQSNMFLSENIFGKYLCYVGTHTFEVYLIHYFFIPKLAFIGLYLIDYPNVVLELIICLLLTILVVICSLIIGRIIRTSEILSCILIGCKFPFIRNKS